MHRAIIMLLLCSCVYVILQNIHSARLPSLLFPLSDPALFILFPTALCDHKYLLYGLDRDWILERWFGFAPFLLLLIVLTGFGRSVPGSQRAHPAIQYFWLPSWPMQYPLF